MTPACTLPVEAVVAILEMRTMGSANWYRIGDDRWVEGSRIAIARQIPRPMPLGPSDRWLAVSLADQTAVAYEGDCPVYAALVATGLPGTATPAGLFRELRWAASARLSGGHPLLGGAYELEDVPWLTYFLGGHALLGAYWHTGFGRPRSHGCVNMTPHDAWWLFNWGQNCLSVYIY